MIIGTPLYKEVECEECGAKPKIETHMNIPFFDTRNWAVEIDGIEHEGSICPDCLRKMRKKAKEMRDAK